MQGMYTLSKKSLMIVVKLIKIPLRSHYLHICCMYRCIHLENEQMSRKPLNYVLTTLAFLFLEDATSLCTIGPS